MPFHQYHTHTHTLSNGIEVELRLAFTPDGIMDFKDYLIYEKEGKLLLGYLTHDSDIENPLEDQDGNGHIYTARRHSKNLPDYLEALGLDSNGSPDLDLIDDDEVYKECERQLRLMADCKHPQGHSGQLLRIDGDLEGMGILKEEDDTTFEHVMKNIEEVDLEDYFDFDDIRKQLWEAGRLDGTVGNKYAVLLDVFEHGMVQYSVAGSGPQCRWDTASGGAVWVPDDICEEEIKRRGPVYQKGKIIKNTLKSKTAYVVRTWSAFGEYDNENHPVFEHWGEAFQYLKDLNHKGFVQPLLDAEDDAAREIAREAVQEYTDYCNGNCFCTVLQVFDLPEDLEEDQEIESDDYDICGGYIGDEYAYDTLKEEFDARKESL